MWKRFLRRIKIFFQTVRDYGLYYTAPIRANKRKTLRISVYSLLVLFSIVTFAAKLNGATYADELQNTRAQLQTLQDQIGSFMQPKQIELGQQDLSVDYILEQTNPDTFKPQPLQTPSRMLVTLNLLPVVSYPYGAFQRLQPLRNDVQDLTNYQYQLFMAIGTILEYNPRAEFGDKALSDIEIKQRIENARNSLANAANKLRNETEGPFDDPGKGEIIRSITSLQKSIEDYSKSRDLEVLAKAVETEQKAVAANRQAFWSEQITIIYDRISTLNYDFSIIEKDLRN